MPVKISGDINAGFIRVYRTLSGLKKIFPCSCLVFLDGCGVIVPVFAQEGFAYTHRNKEAGASKSRVPKVTLGTSE